MKGAVRAGRPVLAALLLVVAAACAPAAPSLPDPGTPDRYPDFLFPEAPDGLGTPAALERHRAGWLWLQAGDFRAAERNFNATLKMAPGFYPAEAGLGYVELAQKDHDDAASHFERAIKSNAEYVPALVGRGEALLALGQRDRALESFERAVAKNPTLSPLRSRVEVLRFRGLQDDVAEARKAADGGRLEEARVAYQRAIAASPQSPFLLRELATVERRAGNLDAALEHARRSVEIEPTDARSLLVLGEIYEAQGDLARAADTYDAAISIEPNPALERKTETLRERLLIAALPPEFAAIETAATVSRAQLAALIGVRLADLLARWPPTSPVVVTDTRGHWASPWILQVTRTGVMEVYSNHTFQPSSLVRRADLAQTASRVLSLLAAENPSLATRWRDVRRRLPDVSPGHLAYPAASLAVEAGVMNVLEDGTFGLARPVSGAEAGAAVRRLDELARNASR